MAGIYPLHLWSKNVLPTSSTVAMEYYLREEIVQLEITTYVRDDPIVEAVAVPKDSTASIIIPNAYSSISIQEVQSMDMRQMPGFELPFVSITELATTSTIFIDAAGLEPGSLY